MASDENGRTTGTHRFILRVYYEDTDLAGIVYYANYLKFIERARSEWVRARGLDQRAMKADGVVFAVRRIEADYLAPAQYDDVLEVETFVEDTRPARLVVRQVIRRGDRVLFVALVTIVCLGANGKPVRLPAAIH